MRKGTQMKKLFLAIFLTLIIVPSANPQSTLHLQEKCAEAAKQFVGSSGGSFREPNGKWGSMGFISHYNKKMDKCFIGISTMIFTHTVKGQEQTQYMRDLYDAIEGKNIGFHYSNIVEGEGFHENGCKVGDKICNSEVEFESLIKSYMEE